MLVAPDHGGISGSPGRYVVADLLQDSRFTNKYSAIVASFDFILAALPIFALWKIQMNVKAKTAICGLMGLGVL